MAQEPFNILPPETVISILSKLPPRTILICKCVCKSWYHLVESREFVKSHLSKSVAGLVTFHVSRGSRSLNFFEIEDGHDVENHDLHYNLVTSFNFPDARRLYGSVDGLIWLHDRISTVEKHFIFICNPITRDYIRIHSPPEFPCSKRQCATYGFGSCRMSGQYKLVRILIDVMHDEESGYEQIISIAECHVYTLGSGCGWRRLALGALNCVSLIVPDDGAFINGNLHWLGSLNGCVHISCFDLETQSFSTFAAAPSLHGAPQPDMVELFTWGEDLCLRDNTNGSDIVIWVMEEYGITKSWAKKFIIDRRINGEYFASKLRPLIIFKDRDILVEIDDFHLFYLSNKMQIFQQVDMFKVELPVGFLCSEKIKGVIHTPSFRSLKSFGMENEIRAGKIDEEFMSGRRLY